MSLKEFRKGWYVAYTKPRHEKKIADQMSESKIGNFLPTTRALRIWNDRKKYITTPLFPSYLFVYLEDTANYFNCLSITGLLYFVRQGKEIATISEELINNIRLMVNAGEALEVSGDQFEAGRKVTFQQGPFIGLTCEVVEHNSKSKVLVRVNLLQRNILMSVEMGTLAVSV